MTSRRSRAARWARRAGGAVALAALAACSTGPSPSSPSSEPSSSVPSSSATATGEGSTGAGEPAAPPPRPITLAFAGDLHFEGVLRDRLGDPATAVAPATRTLAAADLAIVNLETAVGSGGRPEPGKRFTFQAPPAAFAALAAGGIDVATMANNHVLDFGRASLGSTFAAIRAAEAGRPPLSVVGIGRDAEGAFRPAHRRVDGTRVAVIGATVAGSDPTADPTGHWAATRTRPGTADGTDPARLLRAVRTADRGADIVVVYMHWGTQGEQCPDPLQRSLAPRLVEAGADVVVGSHTHGLQGDGRVGPGYVAYGLGNYVWYTPSPAGSVTTGGVLTLTVVPPRSPTGRATVRDAAWEPVVVGADGLPTPVAGAGRSAFADEMAALRACAGVR
ncbi:CapA family protein [Nocardioides sp. TF02-7]|uniref:CapA family protein n=1 Tax=Nocardioides sp. TF02-7 TaxID=2917724 RepID=UPI001F06FADD|nr:CapA family protein [Nocardioides sp. TF02-7]UMG91057.1 CapA family protein [Nocardioides sp. TF02-7]